MSRFRKSQFLQVIKNLEQEESQGKNIDLALSILEYMYDDDCGWIDEYFHIQYNSRNVDQLWMKIQDHLIKNNID